MSQFRARWRLSLVETGEGLWNDIMFTPFSEQEASHPWAKHKVAKLFDANEFCMNICLLSSSYWKHCPPTSVGKGYFRHCITVPLTQHCTPHRESGHGAAAIIELYLLSGKGYTARLLTGESLCQIPRMIERQTTSLEQGWPRARGPIGSIC